MTLQQKQIGQHYINLFERGEALDYGYDNVENDDDGRGETTGESGFTTANGDALEVIEAYSKAHLVNRLTKFIPELERLAQTESGDVSHLAGYGDAWREEAKNPTFRAAQDTVGTRLYFEPAMAYARQYNFTSALGQLVLWDTAVENGCGDDHDSLGCILERVFAREVPDSEDIRIARVLDERLQTLEDPVDPATKAAWDASKSRIGALEEARAAGDFDLLRPLRLKTPDYEGQVIG